jgi:hypothetical protein
MVLPNEAGNRWGTKEPWMYLGGLSTRFEEMSIGEIFLLSGNAVLPDEIILIKYFLSCTFLRSPQI